MDHFNVEDLIPSYTFEDIPVLEFPEFSLNMQFDSQAFSPYISTEQTPYCTNTHSENDQNGTNDYSLGSASPSYSIPTTNSNTECLYDEQSQCIRSQSRGIKKVKRSSSKKGPMSKEERMFKNRISSQKSRDKKKNLIREYESMCQTNDKEIEQLSGLNEKLLADYEALVKAYNSLFQNYQDLHSLHYNQSTAEESQLVDKFFN